MTPEGVREAFEGKRFAKVAMEAGAQSGWVTHALRQLDPAVLGLILEGVDLSLAPRRKRYPPNSPLG